MIASELGSGQYDDAARILGLGLGEGRSGARTPRLRLDLYVTYADGTRARGGVRRLVEGEHGGPDPLRQLLPGRDLRRAARDRRLERAGLRRLGLVRGARSRGAARRRACAPRRTSRSGSSRSAAAGPANGARAGRDRLRHRPEPDRLGRDQGQGTRGHGGRDLLLREARRGRQGQHASATTSSSASCRPTTTSRAARETSSGRRASATRAFSTCSSAAPRRAPLPAGVSVTVERDSAGALGPRAGPRRFETGQATLDRIHRNTTWAVAEQHARASSPTRRSTRRTPGRATRRSRPGTASLLFDTERLYRKMFAGHARRADAREGEVPLLRAEQPELRLRRQARVQAGRTAAAPLPPGTRSGS